MLLVVFIIVMLDNNYNILHSLKKKEILNERQVRAIVSKGQLTQCKFLHQTKHDSGVLAPLKPQTFETGFQSGVFETATFFPAVENGK